MKAVESYAHRAAKSVLVEWLRAAAQAAPYTDGSYNADVGGFRWRVNRGAPHFGIWEEYPVLPTGLGAVNVWDEQHEKYELRPPTFEDLINAGTPPAVIIDVAVQSKGTIDTAFEIFHKHPTSWEKRFFLQSHGIEVIELPVRWILSQVKAPSYFPRHYTSEHGRGAA